MQNDTLSTLYSDIPFANISLYDLLQSHQYIKKMFNTDVLDSSFQYFGGQVTHTEINNCEYATLSCDIPFR
jgi:hypothetical protein